MTNPPSPLPVAPVPGENQQLSVDDLLLLNGRVNAELELERSKRLILVQAYNQLKAELDTLKENYALVAEQK